MNIQDKSEKLHDLIDDFEQALYIKDYKQAKDFKEEIEYILKEYIDKIQ